MILDSPAGAVLTVLVQPNAIRTEYVGIHGDTLKFRVAAPPVDGAANETLCAYLAKRFGLAGSAVTLQSGRGTRRKRILLRGVSSARVATVLGPQEPPKPHLSRVTGPLRPRS